MNSLTRTGVLWRSTLPIFLRSARPGTTRHQAQFHVCCSRCLPRGASAYTRDQHAADKLPAMREAPEDDLAIYRSIIKEAVKNIPEQTDGGRVSKDNPADLTIAELDNEQIIFKSKLPSKVDSLVPYVNLSPTLANLIKLGTDLSVVEKDKEIANYLVKSDFETEVKPYIQFLYDIGVPDSDIGKCFTKCPKLLREPLDDMQVRINYLESKLFPEDKIVHMVKRNPRLLTLSTKQLDTRFGYLQKTFGLTGDELRVAVSRVPRIITWPKEGIQHNRFALNSLMKFKASELKDLMVSYPKVYITDVKAMRDRFQFIHDELGLKDPHSEVLKHPQVFTTRKFIMKQRHSFLTHLGRNQYDPTKENFVSLKSLFLGRDAEFCENVAKVPVKQFNDFLKTL